jgi:hypothetical protein
VDFGPVGSSGLQDSSFCATATASSETMGRCEESVSRRSELAQNTASLYKNEPSATSAFFTKESFTLVLSSSAHLQTFHLFSHSTSFLHLDHFGLPAQSTMYGLTTSRGRRCHCGSNPRAPPLARARAHGLQQDDTTQMVRVPDAQQGLATSSLSQKAQRLAFV